MLDFCLVGRVGFDAQGFHTGVHGLEARGGFFQAGGVEVREDEARAAFVDEGAGAAAADSRGAAGDEGDAVHDVWCHGWVGVLVGIMLFGYNRRVLKNQQWKTDSRQCSLPTLSTR